MNHYERLKVSRDAPIEVIRAAYRALAAKHHPDRHTQPEASHADMAALNAAYEILANPVTRAAYDAEIVPEATEPPASRRRYAGWRSDTSTERAAPDTSFQATQFASTQANGAPTEAQDSRVDINWLVSPSALPLNPWLTRKRLVPLAGLIAAGGVAVAAWWGREAVNQMEAERTLSSHYGGVRKQGGTNDGGLPLSTAALGRPGQVASLPDEALPSDEELLAEPPPLPGRSAPPIALRPETRHPLDGAPLSLREENLLIDPLAPDQAGSPSTQP